MTGFFSGVRVRLLFIVFLSTLPALAIICYSGWQQRQLAKKEAVEGMFDTISEIARFHARVFREVNTELAILAEFPAIRDQKPEICSSVLNTLLSKSPEYVNLGVADRSGKIFCSALPTEKFISIADRTYFQEAVQTNQFSVSNYQVGRISGKACIGAGFPVRSNNGNVEAVIFAGLNLDWLQNLLTHGVKNMPYGQATITVIDKNGIVLACCPADKARGGLHKPELDIIETILERRQGAAEIQQIDGTYKLYVFSPLDQPRLIGFVYAGIPTANLYAKVYQALVRTLIFLASALGLTLIAAWVLSSQLMVHPLKILLGAAKRISAGDLSARTGLAYGKGEIDQLARSFDEMAAELQRRARRLQASNNLLTIGTQAFKVPDFLKAAVAEIARFSRCAAVGIRILRQDGSIPFEALHGFGHNFPAAKVPLTLQRNRCMCLNVIKGDIHPQLPFFTKSGSFYINATSQCPAGFGLEDLCLSCTREAGHESVALVPLRLGQRIIGLIHLADPHENMVPKWLVEDLETEAQRLVAILEALLAQENIRALSHQFIQLQEEERQNLARELHDSLAQDLAALDIDIQLLREEIPPESSGSNKLALISQRLQAVITLVRDLARDLRPPLLDQLGLVQAIKNHCQEFTQRTGIPVDFLAAGIDEYWLSSATSTTLFRLVQEGLNNVRRHAQATQVIVRLVASHPTLILRLEDNGSGFDVAERQIAAAAEGHLGLVGMQERVALLGGVMRLISQPKQGTKLVIEIPVRKATNVHSQDYPDRG